MPSKYGYFQYRANETGSRCLRAADVQVPLLVIKRLVLFTTE
jgi:hypothetical protein